MPTKTQNQTQTPQKKEDIGALWKKVSASGTTFLSGKITVDGVETQIVVFKNTYKEPGDNKPDYKILPGKPQEQKSAGSSGAKAVKAAVEKNTPTATKPARSSGDDYNDDDLVNPDPDEIDDDTPF